MAQALEKDIFTLTWRIENFSMCPQKLEECIKTPEFVVDALDRTTWYLELYPKGNNTTDSTHVSCYLNRPNKEEEPDEVSIDFSLTVISSNTKSVKGFTNDPPDTIVKDSGLGCTEFIRIKTLSEFKNIYTPNDVFTVLCCMRHGTQPSEKPSDTGNVSASLVANTYSLEEIFTFKSDVDISKKDCIEHCVLTTRVPVERRLITWIIKDFKTRMQSAKKIPVSVLSNLREKSELLLSCYASTDWDGDGSVRIDIERKDKNFSQMLMRCKVSVLGKNDVVQESREAEHLFGEDLEVWSFPPVVKLSTIENLGSEVLDGDTLKLQCEFFISYTGEEVTMGGKSLQTNNSLDTKDLKQDLTDMLINQELTDVTLISKEQEIPVHRLILCSRSPVFKAMFTNDTEERRTGVVRITDIDPDTLKGMINFMYKDCLPELQPEDTMKLYSAADEYQFLQLKKQCVAMLTYSLSLSNVCKILVLADTYQDFELMGTVRIFLSLHSKEVFQSDEWNELMKNNLQLAAKLMQKVLI